MHLPWWRSLLLWLSRLTLISLVSTWIISAVLFGFFSNPNNVKQVVADSGFYESLGSGLVDSLQQESVESKEEGEIPVSNPEVQSLIQDIFSPSRIRQIAEDFLDSYYRWLEGKTEEPDFVIDLAPEKQNFATGIEQIVISRLNSLPECTEIPPTRDPFELTCRPPGIDIEAEAANLRQNLLEDEEFLPDTRFTASDLSGDSSNFSEQNAPIKSTYDTLKLLPVATLLAATLAAVAIILLDSNKRKGFSKIGWSLIFGSIGILIISSVYLIADPDPSSLGQARSNGLENAFASSLLSIIGGVLDKLASSAVVYSGIVTVSGVIAVLSNKHIKKRL